MFEIEGKYAKALITTDNIEEEALAQVYNYLNHKVAEGQTIAIMPDVHAGKGCVIGFTASGGERICPNIVGVDIGCGVLTTFISVPPQKIKDNIEAIDRDINKRIPSGFNKHSKEDKTGIAAKLFNSLLCKDKINCPAVLTSLGTLGGGNHYIEFQDGYDETVISIHTGSRNLGKEVAEYYQKVAIAEDKDEIEALASLTGVSKKHYLHDMEICQQYAEWNREFILHELLQIIVEYCDIITIEQKFQTVHNYVGADGVIRKGAIAAYEDEYVAIPLNMRDGVVYGRGKGTKEWNYSAPHGAGRILSRSAAKKSVSMEQFEESMEGIYSTSISPATLDESPFAYKDATEIIELLSDSINVRAVLKPFYNFKAH